MARSRPSAKAKPRPGTRAAPGHSGPGWTRWASAAVYAVALLPPLVVLPTAREAFRLPRLLVSEWLGLFSLLGVVWTLRRPDDLRAARNRWLVLLAVGPLLLLALLSLVTTAHPEHVRRALPSLAIGSACLAGWTVAVPRRVLERALEWLEIPAALLAAIGVLQAHDLYQPFAFVAKISGERMGVTSLAGNPGDLGAYLLLPCLFAQWRLWNSSGARRLWQSGAALLFAYAIAATQTLTALAALGLGSALLWVLLVPRRQAMRAGVAVLLAAGLALGLSSALRLRLAEKVQPLLRGDWNELLTYRVDAWATARWMLAEHPVAGVGFGAFRAAYIPAKEALLDRGRPFSPFALENTFGNAHNDVLEVGAELGWPGLLALAGGLILVGRTAARVERRERPLVWAMLAAMAVVACLNFPFEIALVAYPWLLFLAWILRREAPPAEAAW